MLRAYQTFLRFIRNRRISRCSVVQSARLFFFVLCATSYHSMCCLTIPPLRLLTPTFALRYASAAMVMSYAAKGDRPVVSVGISFASKLLCFYLPARLRSLSIARRKMNETPWATFHSIPVILLSVCVFLAPPLCPGRYYASTPTPWAILQGDCICTWTRSTMRWRRCRRYRGGSSGTGKKHGHCMRICEEKETARGERAWERKAQRVLIISRTQKGADSSIVRCSTTPFSTCARKHVHMPACLCLPFVFSNSCMQLLGATKAW